MLSCDNCFRRCKQHFFCSKDNSIRINLHQLHYWEEPPISGTKGSGTIFFSRCNLACVFCQNYKISQLGQGKDISQDELFNICLELKSLGAHNINFVTPTPHQEKIVPVLRKLKKQGFDLPIVWNCGGYETVEAIKRLDGLVDIYLPDFKYSDNELAVKYSSAPGYFPNVVEVIKEMRRQVKDSFSDDNIMKQGLIIRHLILPGAVQNSFGVLNAIEQSFGNKVFISLMSQYYPIHKAFECIALSKKLNLAEYEAVLEHLEKLGFENGFVQGLDSASSEYTPDFK